MIGKNFFDIMMHLRFTGHQSYVLLCTETTLSNHPAVIPKSSCDVHLLRSLWLREPIILMIISRVEILSSYFNHFRCCEIITLFKKARLCYKYELTLIYHNAACNHWLLALKHSSVAVFSFSFFLAFFFLTFFWFNLVCCFSFKNQFWLSKLDLKLHWRYYYRLHLK